MDQPPAPSRPPAPVGPHWVPKDPFRPQMATRTHPKRDTRAWEKIESRKFPSATKQPQNQPFRACRGAHGRGHTGLAPPHLPTAGFSGRPPPPLCDIPSGCCLFTGPWTVTRSSLRMLRRGAAFCRPLRPVLPLVSFPRSRSPVVGVPGLCWMWRDVPSGRQRERAEPSPCPSPPLRTVVGEGGLSPPPLPDP